MRWPSSQVRDTFVQYFLKHGSLPHAHIPSSSIIPRNDPTLAFVNAGMNQFKDPILGLGRPPSRRVTNSQKCLRINDLSLVGLDGSHHTFFEMLGNWSFADYFKAEACQMAWDLLTQVYKLDGKRMYVTYYEGGNSVPMDEETKAIWEAIGIPRERILPFGSENFWAMGPIGPCGPSTEIHYDHRGEAKDPSEVNKDGGNVVEVWNLVFMQYNRSENGNLERLPLSHVVDTGAGLERLTAVLNGKVSNYDTDLFTPIFDSVQKMSKISKYSGQFSQEANVDRSYRLFADHMRAVTIALSDGILPQTNHKIRKLIHRSLAAVEKDFVPHLKSSKDLADFLQESVSTVAQTLSAVYPETLQMKEEIGHILESEVDRYLDSLKNQSTKAGSLPNLLIMDFPALGRIKESEIERIKSSKVLDGKTAFKWYDGMGVTSEAADELCQSLGIKFDKEGMNEEVLRVKKGFRDEVTKQVLFNSEANFIRKVERFLSSHKPEDGGGICDPSLASANSNEPIIVQWIFDQDGEPVLEVTGSDKSYWVILNKTAFIPGGPTLLSDVGRVMLENGSELDVTKVKVLPSGWILHQMQNIPFVGFKVKARVKLFMADNARVFGREMSAQAIRYLQHWLYKQFKVIRFTGGYVTDRDIKLEFTVLKGDLGTKEIRQMQEDMNQYGSPIVITQRKLKKNGEYELVCATGIEAETINRHGFEASQLLEGLDKLCSSHNLSEEMVQQEMTIICDELTRCLKDKTIMFPYETHKQVQAGVERAQKLLEKSDETEDIKKFADELGKMRDQPYVLRCFESSNDFSSLKKLTKVSEGRPSLVLVASEDGFVQGRCSVPTDSASSVSAQDWMNIVVRELEGGLVHAPKGQDPKLVANLKRFKIQDNAKERLEKSMRKAEEYIMQFYKDKESIHAKSRQSKSSL